MESVLIGISSLTVLVSVGGSLLNLGPYLERARERRESRRR